MMMSTHRKPELFDPEITSTSNEQRIQLDKSEGLPETMEALDTSDDAVMKKIHHALLEVHVISGYLVCTETGRKFPIQAGIPNMLLNQDEL